MNTSTPEPEFVWIKADNMVLRQRLYVAEVNSYIGMLVDYDDGWLGVQVYGPPVNTKSFVGVFSKAAQ